MQILDLESALEKGKASEGSVYINAVCRPIGKENDFMVGRSYREHRLNLKSERIDVRYGCTKRCLHL